MQPNRAWYCDDKCAAEYGRKNWAKGQKIKQKEHRREKRQYDENDYKRQFGLTKKAAQRLAVRLDFNHPCISCGNAKDVQYCGGHYKTAGGHPELALDLRNIHQQCNRYCNMELSGNLAGNKHSYGYTHGLREAGGQAILDYLNGYHPPKNYTCQELIAMRKEYNAEIRRVEQGLPPSRDWRALSEAEKEAV